MITFADDLGYSTSAATAAIATPNLDAPAARLRFTHFTTPALRPAPRCSPDSTPSRSGAMPCPACRRPAGAAPGRTGRRC
ncbi:MAG: hypothetical protein R3F11_14555 [Verrucomicrobiales bacterium]